ncbi:MAG: SpoIID/LytB domain-containing protein [Bacillota bacterium]|jgi:stage II sporulation protein D
MKKILSVLIVSSLFLLVFSANAFAVSVRVLLSNATTGITCTIEKGSGYTVQNRSNGGDVTMTSCQVGDQLVLTSKDQKINVKINGRDYGTVLGPIVLKTHGSSDVFGLNGKKYRGSLTFYRGSTLQAVNTLDVEKYLYGVVGKEIGNSVHLEALKAQAVCSRSFVLANRKPTANYDVTATTSSQVYHGYTAELETNGGRVVQAVDATQNKVLYFNQTVVPAYFSANSGGYTETIENVWGPSSQGVPFYALPSAGDASTSSYSWTKTLTAQELTTLANQYGKTNIGTFKSLKIYREDNQGQPTPSGRLYKLEINGTNGTVVATRDSIRTALGGLRSTLFTINNQSSEGVLYTRGFNTGVLEISDLSALFGVSKDHNVYAANGGNREFYVISKSATYKYAPQTSLVETFTGSSFVLEGKGYGHGVGMSQHGAIEMAKNGHTYEEIITYYFMNDGQDSRFRIADF